MKNLRTKITVITTLFVTGIFFVTTVDARGHRGGGGKSFSRGGHASSGGFSKRSSSRARVKARPSAQQRPARPPVKRPPAARPPAARPPAARPPGKRPGGGNTNINIDRDVHINNNWDHHHGHWDNAGAFVAGAVVGGAVVAATTPNVTYITTLPCTVAPVLVSSINYYRCGSTWYQRGYSGDNVNYVIVNAPPGY